MSNRDDRRGATTAPDRPDGLTRRQALTRLAAGGAVLGLGGVLAACGSDESSSGATTGGGGGGSTKSVTMTLPWFSDGQFSFAMMAKDQGFWEQHGLDVKIENRQGSGAAIDALGAGQFQFGVADYGNMVNGIAKGYKLRSLGVIQPTSGAGVVALAKSGIKTPQDLEGKRYITTPGSGELVLWPAFVELTGIDGDSVKQVYANPSVWDAMLTQGRGDFRGSFYAAVAPTYWQKKIAFNQILFAAYGLVAFSNSIIATEDVIQKDPELCQRFVSGLLEGLRYTYLHPDEAAKAHLKLTPQFTDVQFIRDGIGCTTALGLTDTAKADGLGVIDPDAAKKTVDVVSSGLNLKKTIAPEDTYDPRFARKAAVRLTDAEWDATVAATKRYSDLVKAA